VKNVITLLLLGATFLMPQIGYACVGVFAHRLSDCHNLLGPQDTCNVPVLRFDPWITKHLLDKKLISPDSPLVARVPLDPDDQHAAEVVAEYLLGQDRSDSTAKQLAATQWYHRFDQPVDFVTAAPYSVKALAGLQRDAVLERDCTSYSVQSMSNNEDSDEHFALIVLGCEVNTTKTSMLVEVVIREHKAVRVYNASVSHVCFPEMEPGSTQQAN
jgi:hypothetical protein